MHLEPKYKDTTLYGKKPGGLHPGTATSMTGQQNSASLMLYAVMSMNHESHTLAQMMQKKISAQQFSEDIITKKVPRGAFSHLPTTLI